MQASPRGIFHYRWLLDNANLGRKSRTRRRITPRFHGPGLKDRNDSMDGAISYFVSLRLGSILPTTNVGRLFRLLRGTCTTPTDSATTRVREGEVFPFHPIPEAYYEHNENKGQSLGATPGAGHE
jgi:hypothetical protein